MLCLFPLLNSIHSVIGAKTRHSIYSPRIVCSSNGLIISNIISSGTWRKINERQQTSWLVLDQSSPMTNQYLQYDCVKLFSNCETKAIIFLQWLMIILYIKWVVWRSDTNLSQWLRYWVKRPFVNSKKLDRSHNHITWCLRLKRMR